MKWRPKGWPKDPCDGCIKKQEDTYGLMCDLACGKHSAWSNRESGADTILEALEQLPSGVLMQDMTFRTDSGKRFRALWIPDDKEVK